MRSSRKLLISESDKTVEPSANFGYRGEIRFSTREFSLFNHFVHKSRSLFFIFPQENTPRFSDNFGLKIDSTVFQVVGEIKHRTFASLEFLYKKGLISAVEHVPRRFSSHYSAQNVEEMPLSGVTHLH